MQDDWPEEALTQGLIEHDPRALEACIRRYSREMSYFVRVMLDGAGTPQDAEECTNDLFVAVWQEIDSFDPTRGSLRTWLTMRAKYIALDRRRLLQRRPAAMTSLDASLRTSQDDGGARLTEAALLLDESQSLEGALELRERREEVRAALEALTELDRFLVYMRYFRLASTEEICAKTKLSRQAIDTRLWRARKTLREILEERTHGRTRVFEDARRRV